MRNSLVKMEQSVLAGMLVMAVCCIASGGGFTSDQASDKSQNSNKQMELNNEQIKAAKSLIAQFAASAKCKHIPALSTYLLPDIPTNISHAIEVLCDAKDKDVIADVAAVLVRFAKVNERYQPGAYVPTRNPLAKAFLSSMNPRLPGDEIISYSLAEWICKSRKKMGRSDVLDKEVVEYQVLRKRLEFRYEKMKKAEKNKS